MHRYILKNVLQKLIFSITAIFLIATATFFLFELMPGNIYSIDNIKNPNVIKNIITKYGLNEPVMRRYAKMLYNLLRLDFGNSFQNGQSVREIISTHLPISMRIGISAFLLSLFNGIIIGSIMSLNKNKLIKSVSLFLIVIIYSLPTFEVAALSQYLFCVQFGWFPVICSTDVHNMILPIIILSFAPTAFIARLLSIKISKEDAKDYVLAAKLRYVNSFALFFFYKLKNSMSSIITISGSLFASMVVGSFTVEVIFSIPGLGKFFITSILNRDYPLVMGLTIFYSVLVIIVNYIAEILIILNNGGKHGNEK